MSSLSRVLSLLSLQLLLLFAFLSPPIRGAALTTVLAPQERSCFYAWVDKAGEKVGFYFAVQSGGSFDVDYHVASPSDKVVLEGLKERQLDVVFTGNEVGEYAFCFENDHSNFNEKMIDFDITVESEPRLDAPLSGAALLTEHSAPLEESISKLDGQLTQVQRTQRYFRVWENRGFSTVRGTQSKLFWYSIIESLVVVGISVGQVWLVRSMFEKGSTRRYRV